MVRYGSVEVGVYQPQAPDPNQAQTSDSPDASDESSWVQAPERLVSVLLRGEEANVEVHDGHFGIKFTWHNFRHHSAHIYITMDGKTFDLWNDMDIANSGFRVWESPMMRGIEYYKSRNKPCIRQFNFAPITKFNLDNTNWEGYDQGGTITIKVFRAKLKAQEKPRSLKLTKAEHRSWDEVPSISAVDVEREHVSHLVALDPEELIGGPAGSIVKMGYENRCLAPVDIREPDEKPYRMFKINFRSPAALEENYVTPIEIPHAEIKRWEKNERDKELMYLRTEINKFRQLLDGVYEDQILVEQYGGGPELDDPIEVAEKALDRFEGKYEKLKFERPAVKKSKKRKADEA
ncbi:uncharacterized protein BDZ99DRAFT_497721 [Mytilinidion resinicola]|uniref:Uncharacterized protein n=1 Tax=Mytilinidion resinicola TaxID=574789 RepID=A0A6A6YQE7_9PEZI|nr:uncharacterized protein BDZ99DRAFT_497721 [Mytilinidion resinicola]KAF2810753.1 hypothetical protein BDZ99DRAFT_497721 [Mytilinidion resinicola]